MARFTDIFSDETKKGHKIQKGDYLSSGKYPIIDQGQAVVAGYSNLSEGLFENVPVIVFGDHTRIIKYVDTPFFLGADGVKVLKPKIDNVNCKYLFYCLQNAKIPDTGYNRHFKWLKEVEIPLPSLDKQKNISAVLDKVNDLIAKRQAQLDKLDLLVKARFVEMFGDLAAPNCKHERHRLVDICLNADDIKCGPFGTQLSKDEYLDSGVAVWEIPQINSGFKNQPIHFLSSEKAKQLDAYSLIPGDIAMSRKGNVGRCGLFPEGYEPGIIHSDVLRIRVDRSRVNPCFMMYQLHFSRAVEHQIEMVSSGAVMAGINVTKLKQIYIHVPLFELQQQFADFVGQVEKTKSSINHSLEKLETMKKALMQEYFGC